MQKIKMAAWVAMLILASTALAQPLPTVPGQTGTPEVQRGNAAGTGAPLFNKRVGVISYCGDLSPNAGDFGIFGRAEWQEGQTNFFNYLNSGGNPADYYAFTRNPILDASPIGHFGAQNLVDMINYDDGIPRFREVHLIDGDREQPTAAQLANNFDCVIAITDNKCTAGTQAAIYTQAANALSAFANTVVPAGQPRKGLVLAGMAFNATTGFGDALFNPSLSPFRKASNQLDQRCGPNQPCPIGVCPADAFRMQPFFVSAPECFTCADGATPVQVPGTNLFDCPNATGLQSDYVFQNPVFTPVTATSDFVCEGLLQGVFGPTSSSFASEFANPAQALSNQGTACLNYENGIPLLAVNRTRNVVGLNLMPTYAADLAKTWFSCIVANAAILACGEKRCALDAAGNLTCN